MNYKMMGKFLSQIMALEAAFLLPALAIGLGYGEFTAVKGILYTMGIIAAVAGLLFLACRRAGKRFGARDGLACVGLAWIVLSLLGALPFTLSGAIPKYIDAFFETVSGFTTTGASILSDVEALPKSLLYWRSFTHWVGGMGVLVFLLAIAPGGKDSGFTMHLLRAESPGPDVGKLVPKMRLTAIILYVIYIALTVIDFIFLLCGKMPVLDALCTAFGTAGTGGFGIYNDSMTSCTPYIQNVTTVFMFLFGVNFSCYYLLRLRQFSSVFKDEELRTYIGIVILAILIIMFNIRSLYDSWGETLRHSAFQVSSIITTTGFTTADYELWPALSKGVILSLMVLGACAGSTGGGLKIARALLLFKSLRRNTRQLTNPNQVQMVRNNGRPVSETVVSNTQAYLAAYVIIIIASYLLISLNGYSIGTNISAVLCCFNNIGPGMEAVGPTCNFSHMSTLSKLVLSADMLAGRLEIFPMLILLSRSTWKKR